ncbi:hypothetical protein I6F15_00165 [Bradyrhizobium sp. BRP14]|nr:hypothetical protein [Bradyrhizobium sp. BRP14]
MANVNTKNVPLGSVAVSIDGIRKIWRELNDIVREQGEIEISTLVRNEDQSEEDFQTLKNDLRSDVFKILGTVEFEDGSSSVDSDPEIVQISPGGPLIRSVYLSNITPYRRRTGIKPEHSFELILDFSQPPLLDPARFISVPTPNNTILTVEGARHGWRAGIEATVWKHVRSRRPIRRWFHGAYVYDLFLLGIGLPFAFYACWYLSSQLNGTLSHTNSVVVAAAYLYVGLFAVWIYRLLFSYAKWAFPLVEITDQSSRPSTHRKVWWSIVIALSGKVFWDVADPYVSIGPILKSLIGS